MGLKRTQMDSKGLKGTEKKGDCNKEIDWKRLTENRVRNCKFMHSKWLIC